MQFLEINWGQFIDDLPRFQSLPREVRHGFVTMAPPSTPVFASQLGKSYAILCASGLLTPDTKGTTAGVAPRYRLLLRVLRALFRHRIFDAPSRQMFGAYFTEHFNNREREALLRYAGCNYYGVQDLYPHVASVEWLDQFLDGSAEKQKTPPVAMLGNRALFAMPFPPATLALVRRLMGRTSPLPFLELRKEWPEGSADALSYALALGMSNLLLFPALRGNDLEPVLGIWPSITKHLYCPVPKPPAPVTPREVFEAPFLMDDMASILSLCAAEPFRLRSDDGGLFARSYDSVVSALIALPAWVDQQLGLDLPNRIESALEFLQQHGFVERTGEHGVDLRLEIAEAGRDWLGKSAKSRLKTLLDRLLGNGGKPRKSFEYERPTTSLVPFALGWNATEADSAALRSAVLGAYSNVASGIFVRLDDFVAYEAGKNNPFLRASRNLTLLLRHGYVSNPGPEEIEEAWGDLIRAFLRVRLLPLGAVKIGQTSDRAACFALTEVGRYLIGAQPDFRFDEAAGHVMVQPNFDVVFLAPAPRAEAEIGLFAERKGRHVGTLFKITKRSVLGAAAKGLTWEQTSETLRQCCSGELPANVQREISGWFAQCRRVNVRSAVLIRCPDAETAARVQAIAGPKATPVSDTLLELHDWGTKAALAKRLREAGIFVTS